MTFTSPQTGLHVVHATTVHQPFDVRIFHKECVTLAEAGYRVTLLQRGSARETRQGVAIEPLPEYRSRIARMTLGVWRAVSLVRRLKPALVHLHDIELVWGGILLKALGYKVVYDVHEDVAKDLADKAYLPTWVVGLVRPLVHAVEGAARAVFDQLVTATRAINARFEDRTATLVRNTPILGELAPAHAVPFSDRPMEVGYLGGLATFNNPHGMVAALEHVDPALGARLVLGGKFPEADLETQVRARPGWHQVDFRGWVDRREIPEIFSRLRCGLVLYLPTPNVIESEPNKFFEFLSAGVPLIASNFPRWRDFIEDHRCGLTVDPYDPGAIARAIEYMLTHPDQAEEMGRRGQDSVLADYNWGRDGRVLVDLYGRLLGGPAKRVSNAA
jgi:glycosyltransferase involved in cell wall biosynthesis